MLTSLTPATAGPTISNQEVFADHSPHASLQLIRNALPNLRTHKVRISIDPGKKGAIAVLDGPTLLDVVDMPVSVTYGKPELKFVKGEPVMKAPEVVTIDEYGILDILRSWRAIYSVNEVWLEKLVTRPDVGKHAAQEMGEGVGLLKGCIAGTGFTMSQRSEVTPSVWKRLVGVTADKDTSLEKCRALWPEKALKFFKLKKHDGRAEAALIGFYGHLREAH